MVQARSMYSIRMTNIFARLTHLVPKPWGDTQLRPVLGELLGQTAKKSMPVDYIGISLNSNFGVDIFLKQHTRCTMIEPIKCNLETGIPTSSMAVRRLVMILSSCCEPYN